MSKKSRKRNKKILAMLAIAGGAAMAGRRKRNAAIDTGIASAEADKGSAMLADSAPVVKTDVAPTSRKDVLPVIKPRNKIDHGIAYQSSRAGGNYGVKTAPTHVNGVKILGRINANDPRPVGPTPFHPSQGNRRRTMAQVLSGGDTRGWGGKKGGRVTGIAKRGFGRALMKGKK